MKKRKELILCPADGSSSLVMNLENKLEYDDVLASYVGVIPYHLYVVDDVKPKDGDWVLYDGNIMQIRSSYDNDVSDDNVWLVDSLNGCSANIDDCKKIIATTNTKEFILSRVENGEFKTLQFFNIPEEFIMYYIQEYNKGNIINEVDVEYYDDLIIQDYALLPTLPLPEPINLGCELKVNDDYTINIF